MTKFNQFHIYSPFIVGANTSKTEVEYEDLKTMAFHFSAEHGEECVGKQILEKGSVVMHNERVVIGVCEAADSNSNKRYFIVTTLGADGKYYWIQNMEFVEVNEINPNMDKNK